MVVDVQGMSQSGLNVAPMNECFKKGEGFLKSQRHPASLGALIHPKGRRQIKPEDLIPVAEEPKLMEKRETERNWVIELSFACKHRRHHNRQLESRRGQITRLV